MSSKTDIIVATGVEYIKDGTIHNVSAKKEVILCCGSYQSPQILELSGRSSPYVIIVSNS